jgi:hypothetical protein
MASHLLGVLEPAVVLQVNRDTGCPPGVTSHRSQKTRRLGPLPNRSPGVVAIKSSSGHCRFQCMSGTKMGNSVAGRDYRTKASLAVGDAFVSLK